MTSRNDIDVATRMKDLLALLHIHDVRGQKKVRIGAEQDGGYVMLPPCRSTSAALSLGVGNDVSWDYNLAETGIKVYQFDHTVGQAPLSHDNFSFFKIGAGRDLSGMERFTPLSELLRIAGCQNDKDLILKVDIEDYEWGLVLDETPDTFLRFSQIVGEFHGLLRAVDSLYYKHFFDAISLLKKTHEVVHVHANNWGQLGIIANIPVPDVLEITFARKSDHEFIRFERLLPSALDRPCHPGRPDIFLGSFRFSD
jgi:hypothetical protein